MKRYVAIYGGTALEPHLERFVELLARTFLEETDFTLVIGGFGRRIEQKGTVSVDRAVARGARAYLEKREEEVADRLETWLPGGRDRRDAKRFSEGLRVVLRGQSDQARRFRMVADVSAIVTVHGEGNTRTVLDLAFAIGRPALPLGFSGGDSRDAWEGSAGDPPNRENLEQMRKWFGLEAGGRLEGKIRQARGAELTRGFAREIVGAVRRAIRRKCLVLMRYDRKGQAFYDDVLAPMIERAGAQPVRVDRVRRGGDILALFLTGIAESDAVVVDVTGAKSSPNVMYEMGHLHARNIQPLAFARVPRPRIPAQLPIYLREQKVEPAGTEEEVRELETTLRGYLEFAARPVPTLPARGIA